MTAKTPSRPSRRCFLLKPSDSSWRCLATHVPTSSASNKRMHPSLGSNSHPLCTSVGYIARPETTVPSPWRLELRNFTNSKQYSGQKSIRPLRRVHEKQEAIKSVSPSHDYTRPRRRKSPTQANSKSSQSWTVRPARSMTRRREEIQQNPRNLEFFRITGIETPSAQFLHFSISNSPILVARRSAIRRGSKSIALGLASSTVQELLPTSTRLFLVPRPESNSAPTWFINSPTALAITNFERGFAYLVKMAVSVSMPVEISGRRTFLSPLSTISDE